MLWYKPTMDAKSRSSAFCHPTARPRFYCKDVLLGTTTCRKASIIRHHTSTLRLTSSIGIVLIHTIYSAELQDECHLIRLRHMGDMLYSHMRRTPSAVIYLSIWARIWHHRHCMGSAFFTLTQMPEDLARPHGEYYVEFYKWNTLWQVVLLKLYIFLCEACNCILC